MMEGMRWALVLAILLLPGGCAVKQSVTCRIDGREVSPSEFDRVFKTLKEIGGWYCAETNTGGRTGWKAEDPKGVKYQYTAVTEGKNQTQTLDRLP